MKHVVIIGNGISGITAARHIRKMSNYEITVISSESKHFYSRTALMYIYMGHMTYSHTKPYEDWFWKKNRINLLRQLVKSVNTRKKELIFGNGISVNYDILILAIGSKPNKFGWTGQELNGVTGMYSLQDLENIEKYTHKISKGVIVGGGLIGIELAEMLHSRGIPVTFLIREKSFWNMVLPKEESSLITRHILEQGIDLHLNTELKKILPDKNGRVRAVITSKDEEISCQFAGLTAGVSPNIEFLKNSYIDVNKGILVNEFLETNIPDIYAIGDCAEHRTPPSNRKAIEQVWYTGRIQGESVAKTICGTKSKYSPGIWFNSAKFFDIEYQTYGWVWNSLKKHEEKFYWEDKTGRKCIKIIFEKNTKKLLGINCFGIRLKQEVINRWINEKATVEFVINNLCVANFNPEFSKKYEKEIKQEFLSQLVKV